MGRVSLVGATDQAESAERAWEQLDLATIQQALSSKDELHVYKVVREAL